MKESMQRSFKNCATCEFWGGERDLAKSNLFVYFERGTTGKCANPSGRHKGSIKHSIGRCDDYKKIEN